MDKATFAAGCFWGVEDLFMGVEGVKRTTVGYTGGEFASPSYEDVCTNTTGHAEAILIEFDPGKVSFRDLLEIFWKNHDPTALNRQGSDVGTQYRSAIFYHNEEQRMAAEESKRILSESGKFERPIITEIVPAVKLWPAEEYHQKYNVKRGGGSCGMK